MTDVSSDTTIGRDNFKTVRLFVNGMNVLFTSCSVVKGGVIASGVGVNKLVRRSWRRYVVRVMLMHTRKMSQL
ncbi:uncharacterized protein PHALS_12893 [Plasmopara halstedii]|uniref:Uncharacterized protein n=1 Tax=Plasmopara halstedii TaxID=4781 RepID=A0A0P1ANB1_PLAHL|nr:uncharacterized protein PHALS_12893 [Plasmopara halstedii]CEG42634.1 hypothetical protein PHALS_12893 [Plasmopara halstedii]|eukprot:XP_024579003.1 hypothetical protein PHALS_12893 [Plasmopara halstedii]